MSKVVTFFTCEKVKVINALFVGTEKIKKKVVFIDKPLPLPHPSKANFSRICHKLLLKSNLCQFEAFKFPSPDIEIENADNSEEIEGVTEKGLFCIFFLLHKGLLIKLFYKVCRNISESISCTQIAAFGHHLSN